MRPRPPFYTLYNHRQVAQHDSHTKYSHRKNINTLSSCPSDYASSIATLKCDRERVVLVFICNQAKRNKQRWRLFPSLVAGRARALPDTHTTMRLWARGWAFRGADHHPTKIGKAQRFYVLDEYPIRLNVLRLQGSRSFGYGMLVVAWPPPAPIHKQLHER